MKFQSSELKFSSTDPEVLSTIEFELFSELYHADDIRSMS